MLLTLKLEVHWPKESPRRLCVKYKDGDAVAVEFDDLELCGDDLIVKIFGESNKVPDVSRYRIAEGSCVRHDDRYHICNDRYLIPHNYLTGQNVSSYDIPEPRLQDQLRQREQRGIGNIVLLLESPHKDEYIADPKRPACGKTGDNIDRCLGTVLSRIEECEGQQPIVPGSHVIISNPIQFQTSLHAIHGKSPRADNGKWGTLRDNVWRTLWNEEHIQQCFRERLVDTYNPTLIINACTGDRKNTDSLKRHVEDFVRAALQNVPHYYVGHPASWLDCKKIRPRRIPQLDNPG